MSNESAKIYAEFTISRISPEIRASLTDVQMEAIRNALIAQNTSQKHSVDVRGTIPLFFAKYYFVLFAGKDKRSSTVQKEQRRINKVPLPIRLTIYGMVLSTVFVSFSLLAFAIMYALKSFLGIDIFPKHHLSDFINFLEGLGAKQ